MRDLRLVGWYSANILGNNDGRILSNPQHSRMKMADKLGVLAPILGYDDFCHDVTITYYPPRGDDKEFWDAVDITGFLGLPMQLKLNFLGRDSILAAPIVLDVVRLLDLALRQGEYGIQRQLNLFFKHPLGDAPRGFHSAMTRFAHYYNLAEPDDGLSRSV